MDSSAASNVSFGTISRRRITEDRIVALIVLIGW